MMLIWTIAWSIFAANPMAAYSAERHIERSLGHQADVAKRIASSKAAVSALGLAR